MNNAILDPYIEKNSLLHRFDARLKLLLVLGFLVTTALTPAAAWPIYIILFSCLAGAAILSEIAAERLLRRSMLALPFILAAVPLLFSGAGEICAVLPLRFTELSITHIGLERFISLVFKAYISVQAAVLLAATTPLTDITAALAQLGLPRLLVAIVNLMWRYLFVMVDESLRLLRARTSRSSRSERPGLHSGGSLAWRAGVTGSMAGSLFLRSYERSERVYQAMQSRGYDGTIRTLSQKPVSLRSRLVFSGSFLTLLMILVLGIYFGI